MGGYTNVEWRGSLGLIGSVMLYVAIPLLLPLGVAIYYGEAVVPFVVTIAVTLGVGGTLQFFADIEQNLGPCEAFLAVAVIWFLVAAVGAIPFLIASTGTVAHPVNALFASMSGLTTTGVTVLAEFEIHDRSIMLWRQMIQWLGGLGIWIRNICTVFCLLPIR